MSIVFNIQNINFCNRLMILLSRVKEKWLFTTIYFTYYNRKQNLMRKFLSAEINFAKIAVHKRKVTVIFVRTYYKITPCCLWRGHTIYLFEYLVYSNPTKAQYIIVEFDGTSRATSHPSLPENRHADPDPGPWNPALCPPPRQPASAQVPGYSASVLDYPPILSSLVWKMNYSSIMYSRSIMFSRSIIFSRSIMFSRF